MKKGKPLSRDHVIILVLAVLREGSRHGYQIAREVERRSGDKIRFHDGTLYPVLHALEQEGCIVSALENPDAERPRRIYTLNEQGLGKLEKHLDAWNEYTSAIQQVLKGDVKWEDIKPFSK